MLIQIAVPPKIRQTKLFTSKSELLFVIKIEELSSYLSLGLLLVMCHLKNVLENEKKNKVHVKTHML